MRMKKASEVLDLLRKKGGVQEWNAFYTEYSKKPGEYSIDLSGADLSGLNLGGANLFVFILSGANLSRTNLALATLDGADLSGANLSRTCLVGASLLGTILTDADLTDADLTDVKVGAGTEIEGITGLAHDQQEALEHRMRDAERDFDRSEKVRLRI